MSLSPYWNPRIATLTPYVPGEQPSLTGLVKLNTNELPYPPSPRVVEAITAELGEPLRRYPDPEAKALRAALAARFGLTPEWVFVGNGSDEVLAFAFAALLGHRGPVRHPEITYSFYPVYCRLYQLPAEPTPLAEDFTLHLDPLLRPGAGGIVFPNPNAPTGIALSLDHIETIVAAHRGSALVLIDEAYIDFGAVSAVPLLHRYDNLLIVQTFSKGWALAGLRVGFALGSPPLIDALTRVKDSFNSYPLDRLAQAGALAALSDEPYYCDLRRRVIEERARLTAQLTALGFRVLPSYANFLFAAHPRFPDGRFLATALRERAVLVRHFPHPPRIAPFLRITIGTPAENDRLLAALAEIIS
ncbi:MAG: histidinol-phosphate transaminase [Hydrogenophilus sp.]|nr:histidinol-phosphate transaminase [Hydrogenophilus sp.]